jgi:hypothetical protein
MRRIWLLFRGRAHLHVWKDAASAARRICKKVILPRSLTLLLDLDALPLNQWERITELWGTMANPLAAVSPGI